MDWYFSLIHVKIKYDSLKGYLLFKKVLFFICFLFFLLKIFFYLFFFFNFDAKPNNFFAQSTWTVKYTDCFSAEKSVSSNKCPRYDTKQTDGEVPVILEFWGMWSTPSLPSLPGSLWPSVVAPDRVLSMSKI